jgi:hypothetical protein
LLIFDRNLIPMPFPVITRILSISEFRKIYLQNLKRINFSIWIKKIPGRHSATLLQIQVVRSFLVVIDDRTTRNFEHCFTIIFLQKMKVLSSFKKDLLKYRIYEYKVTTWNFLYPDAEIYSFQVLQVDFPKLPLKMTINIKLFK